MNKLSLKEAQEKFYNSLLKYKLAHPLKGESISTEDSLERITAEPIFAKMSSPYYQAAAMDGVVVRAKETYSAYESSPVILKLNQNFHFINTGNPIPFGFDAVIKIEDINPLNEFKEEKNKHKENITEIEIFSAVSPGQHIRNMGEDVVANQLIIPINHKIRPVDIGALLAGGVNQIFVRKQPKIAIIPTGDELINPGKGMIPGKIIEYNSKIIKALIYQWGGKAKIYEIVKDIPVDLKRILLEAVSQNDVVVVLAGTSAGSKDFTSEIVKSIGDVVVHGVAIMPGKPTILGIIDDTPLIGLPGYPVSAIISAEQFLKPLVFRQLGLTVKRREEIKVHIAQKVVSRLGDEEFLRVKLGDINGEIMAYPLSRGAGVVTSLVEADALVRIPLLQEGVDLGEEVEAELLEDLNRIKNNIIVTGSHDLILDILRNELQEKFSDYNLVSFNVGSMGGLLALKQKKTHFATSHLLDPESGEYNLPYIKKLLPQRELMVVNLAYREQGIMVKKGNPKNIQGIDDLVKKDLKFINRQKGSGTRVLLDYLLKKKGINPLEIPGYSQEVYTHLMVASAVAGGNADTGLGIFSAAKVFDLDFVPVIKEKYDIIIPKEYVSTLKIQKILAVIKSRKFKKKVLSLGGYDLSQSGKTKEV